MVRLNQHSDIRLSLPSKGRLAQATLDFLAACGLEVEKPNPRQYAAHIPALPGLTVLFQRPGDIVVSVRDGSVDFGITGIDVVAERQGDNGAVLMLHDALNFGQCRLCLAVPEEWETVHTMADLATHARALARPLRVATKFPHLTSDFLDRHAVTPYTLINVEGTLEVAPAIGYADLIADLASSGPFITTRKGEKGFTYMQWYNMMQSLQPKGDLQKEQRPARCHHAEACRATTGLGWRVSTLLHQHVFLQPEVRQTLCA